MPHYRRSFVPGGCFFFSVTLADRRSCLLVEEVERLRQAYAVTHQSLPFLTQAVCILPDHLHAIWTLPAQDSDYARRWSLLKSSFSRALPMAENRSRSECVKREKGIWQRCYWEHRIKDEEDLQRHIDYIHYNPVKHGLVERVGDWPYSSFHRYVQRALLPADWAGGMQSRPCTGFGE